MSEPLRVLLAGNPDAAESLTAAAQKYGCDLTVERDEREAGWDLIVSTPATLSDLVARYPGVPIVVPEVSDEDAIVRAIDLGGRPVPAGPPRLLDATLRRALHDALGRRKRLEREREAARTEEHYQDLVEIANDVVLTVDLQGNFTALNAAGEAISGYTRDEVRRMNMRDVLTPQSYARAMEKIQQKLHTGRPTTYELDMIARDGRIVPLEVSSKIIYHDGTPAGVHAIARDVTERRRAEEELRSRERKQAAVARLGRQALETAELSNLFWDAVRQVAETLDVEYCTILQLLRDGTRLVARAGVGWGEGVVEHESVATGPQSQAGYALLSSEPVVVPDLQAETRFTVPRVLREHGARSGASVIIRGHERPFGVLSVFSCRQRDFTQDDVQFLQVVAHVLAAAVERKRLEDERAQHDKELAARVLQAQEDERRRIARELHDETAQTLSILLTNLDLLHRHIEGEDEDMAAGFRRIEALARRALDETRALSHDLRPTILDDAGLCAALEWIAAEHEREFGARVAVRAPSDLDGKLSSEVEVALFRIAQEALTNSGKHANAKRVRVTLSLRRNGVELLVKDNGRGFDPECTAEPTREGGLGIYGMAERAALLGGSLEIQSTPETGTTLRVRMPRSSGAAPTPHNGTRAGVK
jgi:PAS domain S-box-containing protein